MQNPRIRMLPQTVTSTSMPENTVAANVVPAQFELQNRRSKRSQAIMEAVRNLDMTSDVSYRQQLIDWLREAYEARMGGELIGIFGRCYLGPPYVDHRMTIAGNIVEHYALADDVPPLYSAARPLAQSGAYSFIEVYSDGEVVPIRSDGSAS